MNVKVRKIEVDRETADLLEARAASRGMSVAELLADMARNEAGLPPELSEMRARSEGPWSPAVLEEDARRLADFERARVGVPWEEIKAWTGRQFDPEVVEVFMKIPDHVFEDLRREINAQSYPFTYSASAKGS